jgi:hypothetical protein
MEDVEMAEPDEAGPSGAPPSGSTAPAGDRPAALGEIPTVLLALLGLFGALLAWRVGVAGSTVGDANDAGLDAARARSAAIVANEGLVSQSEQAWLDYERQRRRAAALLDAGFGPNADQFYKQAAAHWFLVRADYLDAEGTYDAEQQRASLLADATTQQDLDSASDFDLADDLADRINGLTLAGFIAAAGLPFLTLAEAVRDRRRILLTALGAVALVAASVLAALSWA